MEKPPIFSPTVPYFYGGETTYLLAYSSMSLDEKRAPPASVARPLSVLPSSNGVGKRFGGIVSGGRGEGREALEFRGGLHMSSVPPSYWKDKVHCGHHDENE